VTAGVDPEEMDVDLDPDTNGSDPAKHVLSAVEKVNAVLLSYNLLTLYLYSISTKRLSRPFDQVLNVAKPGHMIFSSCTSKEPTQARCPTTKPCIC
jgi:hypothetical protein